MKVISEIEVTYPCYGPLEDKLLRLFRSGAPDFALADTLVRLGADVNAEGTSENENILSEILFSYAGTQCKVNDSLNEPCKTCKRNMYKERYDCSGCPHNLNPDCGRAMVQVIHWFLEHGFDVTKKENRYGAQCLDALVLSTFDASFITATKTLLDAGAKNVSIYADDDYYTPWTSTEEEGSYQGTAQHDHPVESIYEAVCQIYQALADGRPYSGIDSYEKAVGKRILRVLAKKPENGPVFFDLDLPGSQHQNCFTTELYIQYEGGVLITTQYADFWTDTILPDAETVDVSDCFPGIIGSVLQNFTFGHNDVIRDGSHCGQPVVTMEMDNGRKVTFSINFGEVPDESRAAYYSLS